MGGTKDTNEEKKVKVVEKKYKLNWIVTLLLSVFLGSMGVDRFMMRQIGWGLLKLVTFGGFGIWWLIDIILIATKHEFKNVEWEE